MTGERYRAICALHLLLVRGGQILLSRRFNTGYEDGNYSVPAGHLEPNEPVTVGMAREVGEEIGVVINPKDLEVAHVMHRNAGHGRIDFFFTAKKWEGEPENKEPEKCDGLNLCTKSVKLEHASRRERILD